MIFEEGLFAFILTVIYCSKVYYESSLLYTSAEISHYDAEIAFALHFHAVYGNL